MKKAFIPAFVLFTILGCQFGKPVTQIQNDNFRKELIDLKTFFHIPGIAVIVKKGDQTLYEDYMGLADVKNGILIDSGTTIPMASLTKIFSGILIQKLVEEKKLSLDEPVNKYVSDKSIADSIKIKHVLSHTSQGKPGVNFYYSSRFSWMTTVIEKASGNSFEKEMYEKVIHPLGLRNTYLLSDSSQLQREGRKIALPYYFEGDIKDGVIEYGYSASAGISSTVRDLAKFTKAIDDNLIVTKESWKKMITPFNENSPYGQGIFSQTFQSKDLIWGYGQYDCYSSLLLKVPDKNLTFIIAGNNNLLSDPARLIYGDVTYSLFAMSFLKNYVFDLANEPLLEDSNSLNTLKGRINPANSEFYRRKLLAQAIAESFVAPYDIKRFHMSAAILEKVFELYPDYEKYSDLTLLHNLSFLKTVAKHKEDRDFTKFDTVIERIGSKLLAVDSNNSYANYYMADFYSNKGADKNAYIYYQRILNAQNFSRNWYTTEAENWIKNHKK